MYLSESEVSYVAVQDAVFTVYILLLGWDNLTSRRGSSIQNKPFLPPAKPKRKLSSKIAIYLCIIYVLLVGISPKSDHHFIQIVSATLYYNTRHYLVDIIISLSNYCKISKLKQLNVLSS
jgi:hypothetical protein